jgi:membrane glycosyltransferase
MSLRKAEHALGLQSIRRRPASQYALLPDDAPLPMPTQPLARGRSHGTVRDRLTAARVFLLLSTFCATTIFAQLLYEALSVVRLTPLQGVFLGLCTLCFAWIALGSSSAVMGFFTALRSKSHESADGLAELPNQQTALLFPVYQEDSARVAATIESIATELIALQCHLAFDVFVLSDSRAPEFRARELRAVRLLRRGLQGRVNIYYRARADNFGKKAGNIAEWVQRFGGRYESFIILDADSIMSGGLIVHLASLMSRSPKAALLQTVPRLVGASTLFAQLQQFAVAFYGPVVAAGFATWHRESGNYWGHNAIIRTQAFAQAAGLPTLSGAPPLGGHIQSHDFVEAAFLRRTGWEVWLLPNLDGSYEGCPPTLIDTAVRDRRWAQGNLQHLRILGSGGLPWVSRLHLAMGTYAYLASALWALSLLIGVLLSVQAAYTLPSYFSDEKTLFPIWPVIDPVKAFHLFLATIVVVMLPKILGIALALGRRSAAPPRKVWFLLGAVVELLASILIAPIFMLMQTKAVTDVLRGRDSGWSVQRRDGEEVRFNELLRFHKWHVLIGATLAIACALTSPYVLAWMAPIIVGLLAAVHISEVTSRPAPLWLGPALATPETDTIPAIVAAVDLRYPEWVRRLRRSTRGSDLCK